MRNTGDWTHHLQNVLSCVESMAGYCISRLRDISGGSTGEPSAGQGIRTRRDWMLEPKNYAREN